MHIGWVREGHRTAVTGRSFSNVCSCYDQRVIRVHGVAVSGDEAAELARRLRASRDPLGVGVAERLERGLLAGVAIINTSRPEAEVLLAIIDAWTPERLREVADSLRDFVGPAA